MRRAESKPATKPRERRGSEHRCEEASPPATEAPLSLPHQTLGNHASPGSCSPYELVVGWGRKTRITFSSGGLTQSWMDVWMDEWMGGWMDGRKAGIGR